MILSETKSICPTCLKVVDAQIADINGKIILQKNCPQHGQFKDEYWGDTNHYKRIIQYSKKGTPPANPKTKRDKGCPTDCGLCNEHETQTVLGVVDVTDRCNLRCPICFAKAGEHEKKDPTKEEIEKALDALRNTKPTPTLAIQYSGGEPSTRDDLPQLVKLAKTKGFQQVIVSTNGLRIANEPGYAKKLWNAGMNVLYLQFDGLEDGIYVKLRGKPLLKEKIREIENCRREGFRHIVLVVTFAKGVNDHAVGSIIRFAMENKDVVRGIVVQPVSYTGRAKMGERITTYDFISLTEKQTNGKIKKEDFLPLNLMGVVYSFMSHVNKKPKPDMTFHPCCGMGTYLLSTPNGYEPINRVLPAQELLKTLEDYIEASEKKDSKRRAVLSLTLLKQIALIKHPLLKKQLVEALLKRSYKPLKKVFLKEAVFVGCMHFMDPYNFDLSRVRKCGVHYATSDGRLIPFCSYNVFHRK
ncbi:7,8-dihydro-6-hydroxymethylpterin dimethyltransferase [uncultured archaeon]|nr:7,8-dihydro-6-hydroxymethylpterin dimethyltransferase [uncultured archaeon]